MSDLQTLVAQEVAKQLATFTADATVKKVLEFLKNRNSADADVVETWSEGSEWYRVWSDGFIEQGGIATPAATEWVTLHLPMATDKYHVSIIADNKLLVGNVRYNDGSPFETTRFKPHLWGYDWGQQVATIRWKVCGY